MGSDWEETTIFTALRLYPARVLPHTDCPFCPGISMAAFLSPELAGHTFRLHPLSYPLASVKTLGMKKKASRASSTFHEMDPCLAFCDYPTEKRHLLGSQDNFQEKSLCSSWNNCENLMLEACGVLVSGEGSVEIIAAKR